MILHARLQGAQRGLEARVVLDEPRQQLQELLLKTFVVGAELFDSRFEVGDGGVGRGAATAA